MSQWDVEPYDRRKRKVLTIITPILCLASVLNKTMKPLVEPYTLRAAINGSRINVPTYYCDKIHPQNQSDHAIRLVSSMILLSQVTPLWSYLCLHNVAQHRQNFGAPQSEWQFCSQIVWVTTVIWDRNCRWLSVRVQIVESSSSGISIQLVRAVHMSACASSCSSTNLRLPACLSFERSQGVKVKQRIQSLFILLLFRTSMSLVAFLLLSQQHTHDWSHKFT